MRIVHLGGVAQKLCTYFMDRIIWKIFENLMKFGQILQNQTVIEQRKVKSTQKLRFKTLMYHINHHYLGLLQYTLEPRMSSIFCP